MAVAAAVEVEVAAGRLGAAHDGVNRYTVASTNLVLETVRTLLAGNNVGGDVVATDGTTWTAVKGLYK